MTDKFANIADDPIQPARRIFLITPHDVNPIDPLPKYVRFNVGGVVKLKGIDDVADVTLTVQDGEALDCRVSHIRDTGSDDTIVVHGFA